MKNMLIATIVYCMVWVNAKIMCFLAIICFFLSHNMSLWHMIIGGKIEDCNINRELNVIRAVV